MDIQSSIIINFILTFLMTIYLFILWLNNRQHCQGIGLYLIGNSIVSVFTLLLWFQGLFPDFLSIILSNTFVIVGQILIYQSIYLFSASKIERSIRIISVLILVFVLIEQIIFSELIPNVKVRIISMTCAGLYCNAILLRILLKSRKSFGFTGNLLIVSVVILIINGISRIIMTLYLPRVQTFLTVPTIQAAFVIIRSIIMAFWPFGFAMLILERSRNIAESNSEQKTLLLRELSHRTRNNMSIITSLINMQMVKLPDRLNFDHLFIRQLLITTQNRINSLALVYRMLYDTKDLSRIPINEYLRQLVENLKKSLVSPERKIDIHFDLDDLIVSIETAGHLGLILNELLTNSLKHAFPDGQPGAINLETSHQEDGSLLFTYSDNGIGVPLPDIDTNDSIGLAMIKVLSEEQLQGRMKMKSEGGFHFSLQFKDNLYNQRV